MATFKRLFPAPEPAALEALQQRTGLSLPDIYREFLMSTNGGFPEPDGFRIAGCGDYSSVAMLYGIGEAGNPGDLESEFIKRRDEIGDGFLPIGHDPGGNYLLLGTIGDTRGRIYYWDSDWSFESSSEEGNVYLVSDGMSEFIDSLTAEE